MFQQFIKHNPGENDLYVRTLELAQVREEDYFSHVIHKDIDGIMQDIREAHRKDTTTADAASPVAEIQKQMEIAILYGRRDYLSILFGEELTEEIDG